MTSVVIVQIRLSVGIEDVEDIVDDLKQALEVNTLVRSTSLHKVIFYHRLQQNKRQHL